MNNVALDTHFYYLYMSLTEALDAKICLYVNLNCAVSSSGMYYLDGPITTFRLENAHDRWKDISGFQGAIV